MKTSSATPTGVSPLERVRAWARSHRIISVGSFVDLLNNRATSFITLMVLGIATGLPLLLYVVLVNVLIVTENFDGNPRVSIYLKKETVEKDIARFLKIVEEHPNTASLEYISPEEALVDFQSHSNFSDVLNSLSSNPLPALVELIPRHTESFELRAQINELEGYQEVDMVIADLAWIERLNGFISLAKSIVILLALMLGLGVLLILGNTVRLSIENRRHEIQVVKLVGGTDGFVRRPFLYLGFWYGLGGGISAWLLVHVCLLFLSGPVELIAQSYRNEYALIGLTFFESVSFVALSSILGLLGSALAVRKHLRASESAI